MDYKRLIIQHVHEEVPGFKTLTFQAGHGIQYAAGQFITLVHTLSTEEIRRSYSVISAPALNEDLAIGVKRIPNGAFSRMLVDKARPGDVLWSTGAGGFFTLPENINSITTIIFFCCRQWHYTSLFIDQNTASPVHSHQCDIDLQHTFTF